MKKIPRRYYYDLAGTVLMLIAYFALFHYCAKHDVVSQMLAGGPKTLTIITAVLFISMRLFIILILPGCILARIGLLINYLYSNSK